MIPLETWLLASLQLAAAPPELREVVRELQRENAHLRALNAPIDFELGGDVLPALLRKQV